ncbi:esterase-like activity of phytase family protein [Roseateles sp.]|uniref:esterase-like activity of phytase family protein n=1 Tax=Roseateles sp. TaxID=1971397 RepID=UPI0031DD5783
MTRPPLARSGGAAVLLTIAAWAAALLGGCAPLTRWAEPPMRLRLIGETVLARVDGDPLRRHLGGISGLDYDPVQDTWYLLSDDRSDEAPARFYTATMRWSANGIEDVRVTGLTTLLRRDGQPYPNRLAPAHPGEPGPEIPDPEAVRLDPRSGRLLWSSEGDRPRGIQPFIRWSDRDGRFAGELPLPERLCVHPDEPRGARDNLSLEGLGLAADGTVWASMEAPLIEDGEPPTLRAGALTRFTHLDRQGHVLGQYAYPVDPIPLAPTGGQHRADNGVSELLVTPAGTLLVLERSGREVAERVFAFHVRLYEARLDGATDVAQLASLRGADVVPMRKRLVLDLQTAGVLGPIDNLEGMAWGPVRPNGRRTLVMISDDNFSPHQRTQVLAFEVDQ